MSNKCVIQKLHFKILTFENLFNYLDNFTLQKTKHQFYFSMNNLKSYFLSCSFALIIFIEKTKCENKNKLK